MFNDAQNELVTVRDLLRFAVSRFQEGNLYFGHGSENAYDEAAYLILHALHLPLDKLEPFLDAKLTHEERKNVISLLEKRAIQRIPAAYLTKEAWLGDFRFYVDERVIVPRSFIAEFLEDGLSPWIADTGNIHNALDLCTGSGCLAILMAHIFSEATIDAVDISSDALAVAKINVSEYGLTQQINLIQSDLFKKLNRKKYDLIISNPPYVTTSSMQDLPEEYRHEPSLALAAGDKGLDAVTTILQEASNHLTPEGILVVEVGYNRELVEAAYPHLEFTWLETSKGNDFVFLLDRSSLIQL